jgi:hypothetical protein
VSELPYAEPPDPFAGDPHDPAAAMGDQDDPPAPLSLAEREDVLADLTDLEVYEALLAPRGILGLVIDCEDCGTSHYYGWYLLKANLRHLLEAGQARVHEPAYDPDPSRYVTWEYARGYAEGTQDALADATEGDDATAGSN